MSKANPAKATAALMPLAIKVEGCDGLTVRPVTLGMYAALERINSPMVTGKDPVDTLDLIPSLYLITHDPREIFAGDFLADAVHWADSLGIDALGKIREAASKQLNTVFDVIPENEDDEKKKDGRLSRLARRVCGLLLRLVLRRDHVSRADVGDRAPLAAAVHPGVEDIPPAGR